MTDKNLNKNIKLFQAYGIELEYMLVDLNNLNIVPLADLILGETGEKDQGAIAWSNELALHVIEIKTNGPTPDLVKAVQDFQENIKNINQQLKPHQTCLLPTAAHPWFDPKKAKLWPHECNDIYRAYDRIFNCQGHGWVNLQSTHLNLPFSNDQEFKLLHTAIRLILPVLPALSASSPFLNGQPSGVKDIRLDFYNHNQKNIPEISGLVIPELVFSQSEYQEKILNKSYQAIQPYDPENLLQHEWLNSRGAIARFSRMAIEIRILDIQECPQMDLSIVCLIIETLKKLVAGEWADFNQQADFSELELAEIYQEAVVNGSEGVLKNQKYLKLFGLKNNQKIAEKISMQAFWQHCFDQLDQDESARKDLAPFKKSIQLILNSGCLAERILNNYSKDPSPEKIREIYQDLKICLDQGRAYV